MSKKATVFKIVQPLPKTLSQYWVQIPNFFLSPLLVESATYPTEELGEVAVWLDGQPVYLPTKSKVPGFFHCVVSENALVTNQLTIDSIRKIQSGSGNYIEPFDILVALTLADTGIPVGSSMRILGGSFLIAIDPINLKADAPGEILKWKLKFRYNYIKYLSRTIDE